MLVNKIKETREVIDEVRELQGNASKFAKYESFRSRLNGIMPQCDLLLNTYALLKSLAPAVFGNICLDQILSEIDKILLILSQGDPPNTARLESISALEKKESESLKKTWKGYVSVTTGETIKLLNTLKGLYDDPTELSAIIEQVNQISDTWPVYQVHITKLEHQLIAAKNIIKTLDAGEDVQQFLSFVIKGEATLHHLSPEILEWLNINGFSNNLTISFSKSQRRII